ncbi:hypothetical protein QZH47_03660 [Pseudomonas corrugata]
MVPASERQLLLNDFNRTASDFGAAQPIHQLFEKPRCTPPPTPWPWSAKSAS